MTSSDVATQPEDYLPGTPLVSFKDWVVSKRQSVGLTSWDGGVLDNDAIEKADIEKLSLRLQLDTALEGKNSLKDILEIIGGGIGLHTEVCLLRMYARFVSENKRRLTASDMAKFCERVEARRFHLSVQENQEMYPLLQSLQGVQTRLFNRRSNPPCINWGDV